MKSIFYIIFVLNLQLIYSQNLDNSRKVDWSLAGNTNQFAIPTNEINFLALGGNNTGLVANDALMTSILNSLNSNGAVIYFPAGNYLFNQKINLKTNAIIRGESSVNTTLKFNLSGTNNLIDAVGSITTIESNLSNTALKDDASINISNSSQFQTGDYIKIIDDDLSKITSSWALGSTGQIAKINNINSNTITLSSPLRRNFELTNNSKIVKLNTITNVGVESVTIERTDVTTSQTSAINFNYVVNGKISCVKSYNANFAHVAISNSSNIVVEGSYFQDAFDYGNGGKGYGVVLQYTSGECLIYNNIFNHLRHSILLQAGANGNVISYNYSKDPYWTGVSLPANSAGDLVLHGNYPYCNLFEGNIVQNIVIDDSHGKNGPFNTFFRNRAQLYGIVMNNTPASDSQNFISNEITNTGLFLGNYMINGINHYQYGNNVKNIVTPSGTNANTVNSLYLTNQLSFYSTNSFWPPIGNIANYNLHEIESKIRNTNLQFTRCSSNETLTNNEIIMSNIVIFPNPTNSVLNLNLNTNIESVNVFSFNGVRVKQFFNINKNHFSFSSDDLPSGTYILQIVTEKTIFHKNFIKE